MRMKLVPSTEGQAGEQEPLACGALLNRYLLNRYLEKCHFKAL